MITFVVFTPPEDGGLIPFRAVTEGAFITSGLEPLEDFLQCHKMTRYTGYKKMVA